MNFLYFENYMDISYPLNLTFYSNCCFQGHLEQTNMCHKRLSLYFHLSIEIKRGLDYLEGKEVVFSKGGNRGDYLFMDETLIWTFRLFSISSSFRPLKCECRD